MESGLSGDQRVAIVECIENYIGDWACPDPYDAADFIAARVLEITRAPSDAALVEALKIIAFLRSGGPTRNKLAMQMERIAIDALDAIETANS